jgi:very-short-patch-repair endonuclease
MGKDDALRRLAARQHGAFSRRQALALGHTPTQITKRVARGSWIVLRPGVYAIAGTPATWERKAMSAVLQCGDRTVLSHLAAASVLSLIATKPDVIDVTVHLDAHHTRGRGVRVHRTNLLERTDRRSVNGIPITSPNRTLVDLAGVIPKRTLEAILDDALRRGLTRVSALARFLDRCGRKRGAAELRRLLRDRMDGHTHSELEREFRRIVKAHRLPDPGRQRIVGPFRIDFAYLDDRVLIELDGWGHHSTKTDLQADTRRQTELGSEHWFVLRFSWEDVTRNVGWVVSRIRKVLRLPVPAVGVEPTRASRPNGV